MLNPPTYKIQEGIDFHHNDVLYRRHFNSHTLPMGMLKKGFSLEGLQGSWLKPSQDRVPMPPTDGKTCVVVVDCFSTGAMMAHHCLEKGEKRKER